VKIREISIDFRLRMHVQKAFPAGRRLPRIHRKAGTEEGDAPRREEVPAGLLVVDQERRLGPLLEVAGVLSEGGEEQQRASSAVVGHGDQGGVGEAGRVEGEGGEGSAAGALDKETGMNGVGRVGHEGRRVSEG
jgi:hypothetical protein